MAAIHKISEDIYDDHFTLIALHASLEDHSLVYALNSCLKTKLKRAIKDLEISANRSFPFFDWTDEIHDRYYTLVSNNSNEREELNVGNLFQDLPSYTAYSLIHEYRDVDYFLKVEHDELEFGERILKSVRSIPKVITAYKVDVKKLKSKNNLIF